MNTYDLAGRTAVITGGARGMGLAIGRKFLEAGANVVLWDINEATLASAKAALDGRAGTCPVDVSSFESVEEACRQAVSLFGKIDILVNSAGIAGINTALADYPVDTWNRVMSINLGGVFHTCKAIVPIMKQNGYGRIVNIASMAGKDGNPNASAYSVSKGAVITLTKSLGKELARDGICVNAVAPAVIETEMLADVSEEQIGYMLAKIPMGRMGTVDEIAALVGWLSSQDCSYSTGAVYDLSGGRATY